MKIKFRNTCYKLAELIFLSATLIYFISCSNSSEEKNSSGIDEKKFYNGTGVGPITQLQISETIDDNLSKEGAKVFQSKCITCHKITDERVIGPGLKGITIRRKPEWIMNQILNPLEMTKNDPLSKELLSIYLSQMTDMNLTNDDARNVLEYFRANDKN